MPDAVVVDAVRTPLGRRNGGLAGIHPADLSAHVLAQLVERTGVDPAVIEDVIWGCVSQIGEQTYDIARTAVLAAGWPQSITGVTVDRQCGSSQQSVHFAAAGLVAGHYDAVVAGGVESMSRVAMGSSMADQQPYPPSLQARYGIPHQGIGAEAMAEKWGFSRAQLDEFALRSHARAAAAQDEGRFDAEIAPVPTGDGIVTSDEGVRRGGTLETLAGLKTPFKDGGVISAGNASQISDGAAALLLTSRQKAKELGLRPRARLRSTVSVGSDPLLMLTGPIPATRKVLDRAGLALGDVDLIEINEAFAAVVLAWARELDPDMSKVNPNGGAIAMGHPLGATGAILLTKLINELERRDLAVGLQTMCIGFGQATATIVERE